MYTPGVVSGIAGSQLYRAIGDIAISFPKVVVSIFIPPSALHLHHYIYHSLLSGFLFCLFSHSVNTVSTMHFFDD